MASEQAAYCLPGCRTSKAPPCWKIAAISASRNTRLLGDRDSLNLGTTGSRRHDRNAGLLASALGILKRPVPPLEQHDLPARRVSASHWQQQQAWCYRVKRENF